MDSEDKKKVKVGIAIAAFAIAFYLLLQNITKVMSLSRGIIGIISPFIIGICIAFVLNLLMTVVEGKLLNHINPKKTPRLHKSKRLIALIITIIVFVGLLAALVSFIIPQLAESIKTLAVNIPSYLVSLESFANETLTKFGISTDLNQTITNYLAEITETVLIFLKNSIPQIFETTKNITSGVVNTFLGFIIAIYMLAGKEGLLRNSKRALYAVIPTKGADYFMHVYRLVKQCFSGFVTGQMTEAVIIGVLCFIGMTIFQMQYALLISVIIGVTNMIPIVGPIIGAIPGAFIMLMVDPMKALWFVVFIIVLQQLESNLIYPKVVGDSIGLPGIWVLFAIIVGGALFGLPGVLLGVPTFAVLYTLFAETIISRLKSKKLKIH